MIGIIELRERAREWSLREDIVEKDYVLGWLLWGIASEPALTNSWVFKRASRRSTPWSSGPPPR